ncbi:MAG: NAD-dependent epimerase/dehydratase family protein [Blastocatellia bacterium]
MEEARVQASRNLWRQARSARIRNSRPCRSGKEDLWNSYPEETNALTVSPKAMLVHPQAYREQYGFNSIFLLPVNLCGPRDSFDLNSSHVIPALIRKCVEAVQTGATRGFVAGDGTGDARIFARGRLCRGIVLAAENYNQSEPVNLGAGFEITIKELAEKIARLTGFTRRVSLGRLATG